GFDDKAQARAIADKARADADRKRTGIPQGIDKAGPAAEFRQAFLGPCQVILFLARRLQEARTGIGIAGSDSLRLLQGLRAYLARVVDAHQAGSMVAILGREWPVHGVRGRIGSSA